MFTHAEPFHRYTAKLVSLFELSAHPKAMDHDNWGAAHSALGVAGGVLVFAFCVVAVEYVLEQLLPAPLYTHTMC
jgi:hypothetical protein